MTGVVAFATFVGASVAALVAAGALLETVTLLLALRRAVRGRSEAAPLLGTETGPHPSSATDPGRDTPSGGALAPPLSVAVVIDVPPHPGGAAASEPVAFTRSLADLLAAPSVRGVVVRLPPGDAANELREAIDARYALHAETLERDDESGANAGRAGGAARSVRDPALRVVPCGADPFGAGGIRTDAVVHLAAGERLSVAALERAAKRLAADPERRGVVALRTVVSGVAGAGAAIERIRHARRAAAPLLAFGAAAADAVGPVAVRLERDPPSGSRAPAILSEPLVATPTPLAPGGDGGGDGGGGGGSGARARLAALLAHPSFAAAQRGALLILALVAPWLAGRSAAGAALMATVAALLLIHFGLLALGAAELARALRPHDAETAPDAERWSWLAAPLEAAGFAAPTPAGARTAPRGAETATMEPGADP